MKATGGNYFVFWRSVDLTGNQTAPLDYGLIEQFWRSVDLTGNQTKKPSRRTAGFRGSPRVACLRGSDASRVFVPSHGANVHEKGPSRGLWVADGRGGGARTRTGFRPRAPGARASAIPPRPDGTWPRNRTPVSGFGDRRTAIVLARCV